MITRLFRQRRRIFILSISAALATMLVLGPSVWSLMGLAIGASLAAIIVLGFPTARSIVECLALSLPPTVMVPIDEVRTPIIAGAITLICHVALYGRWSDKTRLRLRIVSRKSAIVDACPSAVWRMLIPGAALPGQNWNPALVDFARDRDDKETLYMRHASPTGLPTEATITFFEKTIFEHCRYSIETNVDDLPPGVTDEAIFDISLTPKSGPGCLVVSEMVNDELPLRLALARWMDDTMGDEWDSFAAAIASKRDWSMTGLRRSRTPDAALY